MRPRSSISLLAVCAVVVATVELVGVCDAIWTYRPSGVAADRDPTQWGWYSPSCSGGSQQSPIDLSHVPIDWNLRPLRGSWGTTRDYELRITPRRSIRLYTRDVRPTLVDLNARMRNPNDGNSNDEYFLEYVEFVTPSGHTFGGSHRDLEVLFVHVHSSATAIAGTAASAPRYVVSATFVSTATGANVFFDTLLHELTDPATAASIIANAGDRYRAVVAANASLDPDLAYDLFGTHAAPFLREVALGNLMPSSRDYFTYRGSMMAPPCAEIVTWAVFAEPGYIGLSQLVALRRLMNLSATAVDASTGAADGNNRPVLQTPSAPYPTVTRPDGAVEQVKVVTASGASRLLTGVEVRDVRMFKDLIGDDILLAAPTLHAATKVQGELAWAALGLSIGSVVVALAAWRIAKA